MINTNRKEMKMGKKMNGMIQVRLEPESRERLLEAFPPKHGNVPEDSHVTIIYRPLEGDPLITRYKEGTTLAMQVLAEARDEHGQAVHIRGIETNNKYAHITISHTDAVSPAYSKKLFSQDSASIKMMDVPMNLIGTVVVINFK
jgi:hypothetical protein